MRGVTALFYLLLISLAGAAFAHAQDTLSGRVYDRNRTTPLGAGLNVSVSINGAAVAATSVTDVNGDYSLTSLTLNPGDIITVFLDDETEDAVTVTVTVTDGTSITELNLYQDYLIADNHNAGSTTNTNLAFADNSADADITGLYSLAGSDLTVSANNGLLLAGSFTPGGAVSVHNMTIAAGGTYAPGANTTTVTGSWDGASGTLTAGTGTVQFTATSGTETVDEDDSFYNLTLNDGAGTATLELGQALCQVPLFLTKLPKRQVGARVINKSTT